MKNFISKELENIVNLFRACADPECLRYLVAKKQYRNIKPPVDIEEKHDPKLRKLYNDFKKEIETAAEKRDQDLEKNPEKVKDTNYFEPAISKLWSKIFGFKNKVDYSIFKEMDIEDPKYLLGLFHPKGGFFDSYLKELGDINKAEEDYNEKNEKITSQKTQLEKAKSKIKSSVDNLDVSQLSDLVKKTEDKNEKDNLQTYLNLKKSLETLEKEIKEDKDEVDRFYSTKNQTKLFKKVMESLDQDVLTYHAEDPAESWEGEEDQEKDVEDILKEDKKIPVDKTVKNRMNKMMSEELEKFNSKSDVKIDPPNNFDYFGAVYSIVNKKDYLSESDKEVYVNDLITNSVVPDDSKKVLEDMLDEYQTKKEEELKRALTDKELDEIKTKIKEELEKDRGSKSLGGGTFNVFEAFAKTKEKTLKDIEELKKQIKEEKNLQKNLSLKKDLERKEKNIEKGFSGFFFAHINNLLKDYQKRKIEIWDRAALSVTMDEIKKKREINKEEPLTKKELKQKALEQLGADPTRKQEIIQRQQEKHQKEIGEAQETFNEATYKKYKKELEEFLNNQGPLKKPLTLDNLSDKVKHTLFKDPPTNPEQLKKYEESVEKKKKELQQKLDKINKTPNVTEKERDYILAISDPNPANIQKLVHNKKFEVKEQQKLKEVLAPLKVKTIKGIDDLKERIAKLDEDFEKSKKISKDLWWQTLSRKYKLNATDEKDFLEKSGQSSVKQSATQSEKPTKQEIEEAKQNWWGSVNAEYGLNAESQEQLDAKFKDWKEVVKKRFTKLQKSLKESLGDDADETLKEWMLEHARSLGLDVKNIKNKQQYKQQLDSLSNSDIVSNYLELSDAEKKKMPKRMQMIFSDFVTRRGLLLNDWELYKELKDWGRKTEKDESGKVIDSPILLTDYRVASGLKVAQELNALRSTLAKNKLGKILDYLNTLFDKHFQWF